QPPLSTDVGDVQQTITIEVICQNDAPIAGDDSYEFHERGAPIFADPLISTVPTVNTPPDPVDLLYNDSDVDLPGDGVDQGFLDVVGNTEPTHATLALTTDVLTVNSDGSFSYEPALLPASDPGTPGVVDSWDELGAFSYTVTWDYTVSDGYLTDTGSVSITIIRVICSDETVRDQDGDVVGAFTLLQPAGDPPKCKPYSVLANAAANAVDFIPEADGGEPELFRGLLAFTPEQQANGEYTLTLIYDPFFDPNDPLYVIQWLELPQCVNPVYQLGLVGDFPGFPAGYQAMLVVDADFDALPLIPGTSDKHSWCWAGDITLPGGGSEVYSIRQVIGLQDPRFGGGGIG
nr:hypothetical protein [Anaerolineae bacterium]